MVKEVHAPNGFAAGRDINLMEGSTIKIQVNNLSLGCDGLALTPGEIRILAGYRQASKKRQRHIQLLAEKGHTPFKKKPQIAF